MACLTANLGVSGKCWFVKGVITRLCIEDSVESRMVMLQEKKANMINGTINNDQVAMEKLTPEDMQFLFRGS